MPVLAVAISAWVQIVAAVHGEPCPALAADDDVARILHAEEAVRLSGHRSRLCAHDHAVREHELDVGRNADRFHKPLRCLPVNDDFRRAGVYRRLQALRRILRVPTERRRQDLFARLRGGRLHRFVRAFAHKRRAIRGEPLRRPANLARVNSAENRKPDASLKILAV